MSRLKGTNMPTDTFQGAQRSQAPRSYLASQPYRTDGRPANYFKGYRKRNAKLREMGYASYQDYLESELWASIRIRVLERDQYECNCCGRSATVAHHSNYKRNTLEGLVIDGIWSLCGRCHRFIEFDRGGNKGRLKEANYWFRYLCRVNNRCYRGQRKRKSRLPDHPCGLVGDFEGEN